VAKPASTAEVDGRIVDKVWMERGSIGPKARNSDEWMRDNAGAGWKHIRHNHINNKGDNNQFTRFGEEYEDPGRVKKLILEAIENGEPTVLRNSGSRDDLFYVYEVPNTNGKYISTSRK
jgi:hypothetical protein